MSRRKINVKALTSLITALINGSITLAILLIAPLGLAAVITNTVLVMIASF
ncbi:CRISPR-associated protein Csx18, partial [Synechococcus sp. R60.3]|uniref:CRISPR-associated protein Csx18 n=1 Tax=Synechococcus sp. R60.3 TaxID=2967123 RepID=UPI0039C33237